MSKKHSKIVARLCKQLDKMRIAFALADDHVAQLQALHDEDVAAIEHPKRGKLPKSGKRYMRG